LWGFGSSRDLKRACTIPTRRGVRRITERRRDPGEGRRVGLEARSSVRRVAPSPGAQDSDGILRRPRRPRVDKREREHRWRGSRTSPSERLRMRFMGIDVAAERHVVAVVDETDRVLFKPTPSPKTPKGTPSCSGCRGPYRRAGRHGGDDVARSGAARRCRLVHYGVVYGHG
jgi:hypothetical protein